MTENQKKSYRFRFVQVEDHGVEIARRFTKQVIEKVLEKHGLISYNLDEVISKYITGEMRCGPECRICQSIDNERVTKR